MVVVMVVSVELHESVGMKESWLSAKIPFLVPFSLPLLFADEVLERRVAYDGGKEG